MADADISLDIFCDTANTIVPKMQKIKMMGKSKEKPFLFFCLTVLSSMNNPHPLALDRRLTLKEKAPVNSAKQII